MLATLSDAEIDAVWSPLVREAAQTTCQLPDLEVPDCIRDAAHGITPAQGEQP